MSPTGGIFYFLLDDFCCVSRNLDILYPIEKITAAVDGVKRRKGIRLAVVVNEGGMFPIGPFSLIILCF